MDNYYTTATRMWNDANLLWSSTSANSWFNTCYLTGYVLECYGKLLINAGGIGGSYGHDLKDIHRTIQTQVALNSSLAKYCLDLKSVCNNIYEGHQKWDPKKRYEDNPSLWGSNSIADTFINESKVAMDKINDMKLDGVI
jgi:hypothetical protein